YDASRGGEPVRIEAPIGLDGVSRIGQALDLPLAVKGRWLRPDTFELVSHQVTQGIVTTATMTFRGKEADIGFSSNQGFTVRLHALAAD
ncbi:MAG TPA: hypothetical protein VLD35_04420, partial [Caldimonas sp.]|nr:hypothetical protein [Caldimonas sp.]